MKVLSVYIWVVTTLIIIGGCSSRRVGESSYRVGYDFAEVDKIAIVAVEGAVKSEPAKNQIAEFYAMELLKKGFAPVGLAHVKTLLKESRSTSGLSEDITNVEGAAQIGQILKVPVVLVVNIPYYGQEVSMTAKMINVEDGSFLWIGGDSGKTEGALSTILGTGAEAGSFGDETDQAFGGMMGGQFDLAGQALTPSEANRVQKLVQNICRSLPSRTGREEKK